MAVCLKELILPGQCEINVLEGDVLITSAVIVVCVLMQTNLQLK